jgi:hypothetical protein
MGKENGNTGVNREGGGSGSDVRTSLFLIFFNSAFYSGTGYQNKGYLGTIIPTINKCILKTLASIPK